jgi:hypothetical protein
VVAVLLPVADVAATGVAIVVLDTKIVIIIVKKIVAVAAVMR